MNSVWFLGFPFERLHAVREEHATGECKRDSCKKVETKMPVNPRELLFPPY